MFAVCCMSAQKNSKQEKVANIDKVNYRITYTGKMVPDTSKVPYTYWDSEMYLDIGCKVTHFYDRTKQVKDSIMGYSCSASPCRCKAKDVKKAEVIEHDQPIKALLCS